MAYISLKKKLEKLPLLDQNHGLTPLQNVNFSTIWTACFYSLERRFFALEYRKRDFPGVYFQKKKVGKMAIFFYRNHGLTPLEKYQFFDLLNFLFL